MDMELEFTDADETRMRTLNIRNAERCAADKVLLAIARCLADFDLSVEEPSKINEIFWNLETLQFSARETLAAIDNAS